METQVVVAIITGAAVVLAAALTPILQERFKTDPRLSIERDLEICSQLPDNSQARKELEKDIERRVSELTTTMKGTRDWTGGVIYIFLAGLALWGTIVFTYWGWSRPGLQKLWFLLAVFCFLCSVAIFQQLSSALKRCHVMQRGIQ